MKTNHIMFWHENIIIVVFYNAVLGNVVYFGMSNKIAYAYMGKWSSTNHISQSLDVCFIWLEFTYHPITPFCTL